MIRYSEQRREAVLATRVRHFRAQMSPKTRSGERNISALG